MSPTIGFVGAGRVAQTLARAFVAAGLPVVAVASRDAAQAQRVAQASDGITVARDAQCVAELAELVLLTVSDDAIEPVCSGITWRPTHRVVHCSGATEVAALHAARAAGAQVGGFHPMQMFANPEVALAGLPGCTVGIEAEGALRGTLEQMARRIGCVPFALPPGVRPLYHASAYYVGPFLIALLQEGAALWRSFGASEAEALAALLPLLRGTVAATQDGGLAKGMGGCVARGDVGTVRTHLAALQQHAPPMAALYRELAARTVPLGLARGTLSAQRAQAIHGVLGATSAG